MKDNDAFATYNAIIACRKDAGKLAKQAILEKLRTNRFANEFLQATYEPRINLYMTKIAANGNPSHIPSGDKTFDYMTLRVILSRLNGRKLTGNAAKEWIGDLYAAFNNDYERELLKMLIDRDVKAGFGANTINKVWPGLVTDVPYMRASLVPASRIKDFPWAEGVFSQIKADGMFANVNHNDDNSITIESRSGSPFPLDQFTEFVVEARDTVPTGMQAHGEFLMRRDDGTYMSRQEGNGLFNKLLQGGELPEGVQPVYECWDMIPVSEAKPKNKYKVKYKERFEALSAAIGTGNKFISVIETRIVKSLKEAYEHYRSCLDRGLEGTVVKNPNMIWEDTTSKDQVKLKLEAQCELRIKSFNPGTGKNEKLFGSFYCESEDAKLKCSVTGIPDDLRNEIDKDRANWTNAVITVTSNSLMPPDNKDYYSLFLPRFEERRRDKTKADTLDQIIKQFEAAIAAVGV